MIKHVYHSKLIKWFFPKWVEAFVFNNTIYFRGDTYSERLLKHETQHVRQYQKYGVVCFLFIYLKDYIVNLVRYRDTKEAYRNIPFEVEARQAEKQ